MCEYCGTDENKTIVEAREEYMPRYSVYISPKTSRMVISSYCGKNVGSKGINFCPMCGRCLKQRLTPAQENAYKVLPRRSVGKMVYGINPVPTNAVQRIFKGGDVIRYKSTGKFDRVRTITHSGRFINSVSVNDVEAIL